MSRRRITATAVLALALAGGAACAQPTSGAAAPAPAAQAAPAPAPAPGAGGDSAAFCAALDDAQGTLAEVQSAVTGASDAAQLQLAGDKIQELAALAPPEIAADLQAVADGFHAGAAGVASDEVGQRIIEAFVRVSQELPRICP
jgi:hypothetical protein